MNTRVRCAGALLLGALLWMPAPSAAFVQTATNGVLSVKADDNPSAAGKIGLFMVGTGAGHPDPNKAVFYNYLVDNSLGTSFITVRDDAAGVLWVNAPAGTWPAPSAGDGGYAIQSMRSLAATQTSLGGKGFRTVYPVPGLEIAQEVEIVGATIFNTSVRHTVTITNNGGAARTVGLRILWDWMVASIDASYFREREPDSPFTRTFTGFPLPAFRRYQVSDSDVLPNFNIFGTTEGGSLASPPTPPDELRYASWEDARQTAWQFTVTGGGTDSAIVYYWGLTSTVSLASGESRSFTQYVTTNLDAFRRAVPVVRTETSNSGYACSGERIVYTIAFSNIGDGTALDLTLTSTVSGAMVFEPGSLEFWAQSDDLGTPVLLSSAYGNGLLGPWTDGDPPVPASYLQWRVNRLAPGKSAMIRYAATVANGAGFNLEMFNATSATYLWDDGYFWGNKVRTIVQGAILQKYASSYQVFQGETVRYTLVLLSPCNATLYNLEVWDSAPAGGDIVMPLTQGGTLSGTTMVFWTVPALEPGRSAYLSFDVKMNGSKPSVFNAAVVAYDAYRLNVLEAQQRVGTGNVQVDVTSPQLYFQKVFDPNNQTPADPNAVVNFGIGIINQFNMTLTNVTVWDSLPDGMTFMAASGQPFTFTPPRLVTFDVGTVGAGLTKVMDLQVQLSASCYDLLNKAYLNFDSLPSPMYSAPLGSNDLPVELRRPHVLVSSVPVNSPLPAGTILDYRIKVENYGLVPANAVKVWDTLPTRATFLSCAAAPCAIVVTPSATLVEWTLGTLGAQSSWELQYTVQIDTLPAPIGPDAPCAVFTIGAGCQTFTVTAYESWAYIAQPAIELLKDADAGIVPMDGPVGYRIRVANNGSDTSYDTLVIDTFPAGLTVTGCSGWDGWSCTVFGTAVHWMLAALPPGVSTEVRFTATVTGPLPPCDPHPATPGPPSVPPAILYGNNWPIGSFKSRVGLSWNEPWIENASCLVVDDALLNMIKIVNYNPIPEGATFTFRLSVSSTGGLAAQNITVWDTLPAGATFVGCTGGFSCTLTGSMVSWYVPLLDPGDTVDLDVDATGVVGMGCTSYGEAAYDNPLALARPRIASNGVCPAVVKPDLRLSMRAERGVYAAGENVTFVLSWTNVGSGPACKPVLRDYLVPGANYYWEFVSASTAGDGGAPSSWQPSGNHVRWDPEVDPGETGGATVTLRPVLTTTAICEFATLSHLAIFDYEYCSPIASSASALVLPPPSLTSALVTLTLTVTAGAAPAGPVPGGAAVDYRITMSNECFQTFVNLVVWETVPAGAVYTGCVAPAGATCGPVGGMVVWTFPVFFGWTTTGLSFSASITGDPQTCGSGALIGPARAFAAGNNTVGLAQPAVWSQPANVALELPCLVVDKTAPVSAPSAQPVVFSILVSNTGNDTAYGVVVVDTLPPPLKYVTASPAAAVTGNVVTWSVTTLAPGAVFLASVTALAPDANQDVSVLNTAVAKYVTVTGAPRPDRSDQAAVNLSASLIVTIGPSPYDPTLGRLKFGGLKDGAVVRIFTLAGVEIAALSGVARHQLSWDGRNRQGDTVAAGIYFYAIEQPDGAGGVTWSKGKFGVLR